MNKKTRKCAWAAMLLLTGVCLTPAESLAHCDTLDGPVVKTARVALEKGDVTPLLKWVTTGEEKEIREAFQKTLAVRAKGDQARELADMYFLETLVRIHRAGEGVPYTGLKPATAVDPAVAMADQVLETGNVEELVKVLTTAMGDGIRQRFQRTRATRQHADESVAAGREFVASYVVFTHYVEGLHGIIAGGGHHGQGAGAAQHEATKEKGGQEGGEKAGGHAH